MLKGYQHIGGVNLPVLSMFNNPAQFVLQLLNRLPAVLLALTLHEWAHGFAAYKLGDDTARRLGRLTINPLAHIDPVGLLCMIFVGFGWAKPVPINPYRLKYGRWGDLIVSVAGVTMNALLFFVGFALFFYLRLFTDAQGWAMDLLITFFSINAVLCAFNLFPIPPLDGYHVLNDVVLKKPVFTSAQASQIGFGILMLASFTGILSRVLTVVVGGMQQGAYAICTGFCRLFGIF